MESNRIDIERALMIYGYMNLIDERKPKLNCPNRILEFSSSWLYSTTFVPTQKYINQLHAAHNLSIARPTSADVVYRKSFVRNCREYFCFCAVAYMRIALRKRYRESTPIHIGWHLLIRFRSLSVYVPYTAKEHWEGHIQLNVFLGPIVIVDVVAVAAAATAASEFIAAIQCEINAFTNQPFVHCVCSVYHRSQMGFGWNNSACWASACMRIALEMVTMSEQWIPKQQNTRWDKS